MQLTFDFIGRKKGALGTRSRHIVSTQGLNAKECFLSLYTNYEHVSAPEVVKAGLRFGFDLDTCRVKATFTDSHLGYTKAVTDSGVVAFFVLDQTATPIYVPPTKIAQLECLRKRTD